MSDVRAEWETGKPSEVAFWKQVADGQAGKFEQWRQNMIGRARPTAKFMQALVPFLPDDRSSARVVDLAAGPVSCVGWNLDGHTINVTPVDALADDYDQILQGAGITPAVRTISGEAERIDEMFDAGSVDLVYIRNALDHCYDVPKVIDSALQILKPGGHFVVHSYRNEAERERYIGLHQWNLTTENGYFILHRPGTRVDVNKHFAGRALVKILKEDAAWIEVDIQKV